MPSSDPSASDGALGREVERAVRRLGEVDTLVHQLSDEVSALKDVEALVQQLSADVTDLRAAISDQGPDPVATRAWLLAEDADQARADLDDLTEWVGRVYLRYPGTLLPSCWLWHPAVIEELWWLRQAHHEAYTTRDASWTKAGDWHDRQRPGVTRRINVALSDCELALHTRIGTRPTVALIGSASRIADTWATQQTTPAPTPDEQIEAEDHDHQHMRRSHR